LNAFQVLKCFIFKNSHHSNKIIAIFEREKNENRYLVEFRYFFGGIAVKHKSIAGSN